MLFKLLCVAVIASLCVGDEIDEQYVDAVINMLLNGDSSEVIQSEEADDGVEPVLSGGMWKCGNCENLDESKLVYSEINEVDDNMMTDTSVDIQIGFTLPGMQCITVQSNTARVVRRVSGACTSGSLTLSVAPAAHFTVRVYN